MARPRATAPAGYMTSEEVCARLGISKPTLGRWREAGKLEASVCRGVVVYAEVDVARFERMWARPIKLKMGLKIG